MNNELTNSTKDNTISSREAAEMMGVEHSNMIKKIDRIDEILKKSNLTSSKYWYETTYKQAGNGKECREYQVTKKGCELIAHNTEGEKGIIFTAKYMDRLEEMEKKLQKQMHDNCIEDLKQLLAYEK